LPNQILHYFAGKSSLGNTLVGNKYAFEAGNRPFSVTRRCKCVKRTFDNNTKLLSVVDTPGFFDTRITNQPKENHSEIARSLLLSMDGPHAFFIVLQCNSRFTLEEKKAIEWIDKVFPGYIKYSIIVFTNIDRLPKDQTLDDYLNLNSTNPDDTNPYLVDLINNCGRRYYGVNNLETSERRNTRVLMNLIEKIRVMLLINGTRYYRSDIVTSIAIAYQTNMQVFKRTNLDDDNDDNADLPNEITSIVERAINS
jgi:GTP-binding protein EngB required for normal cell division